MRKLALLLCSCIVLVSPPILTAQNDAKAASLPPIVRTGLEAYKNSGPQAAIQAWAKGGPLDGSAETSSDAAALNQIQGTYGAYRSFDIIAAHNLTQRIRVLYLALNFERGPVFAKFIVYRTGSVWILTTMKFNPDVDAILPVAP